MDKNRMPAHGIRRMSRGMSNVPQSPFHDGQGHRFGRMFPYLSRQANGLSEKTALDFLIEMGRQGGFLDESNASESVENSEIPAGMTYLGQFIDHDITLDTTSSLERQNDPAAVRNFRTPNLELDSVYGSGPAVDRFLYQKDDDAKLAVGTHENEDDLPRTRNDIAIIGDPRNDENLMVSQLHLAFLKFHNRVVEHIDDGSPNRTNIFRKAQQLVRWHYQWIILHEFLPTICDEEVVKDIRQSGRQYFTPDKDKGPYMPVEFSVAAYRFGHSMVQPGYSINDEFGGPLFPNPSEPLDMEGEETINDLRGFRSIPDSQVIDWSKFFEINGRKPDNMARKIDPRMSGPLFHLPFGSSDDKPEDRSLAARNLRRGYNINLPSGQTVAQALDTEVLFNDQLRGANNTFAEFVEDQRDQMGERKIPADLKAPLWFYILAEAENQNDGENLGKVGSRVVAEVFFGMLENDYKSYLTVQPGWEPTLPASHSAEGDFSMADLLIIASDG